ncbi:Thioredoxin [uncultured Paludibacter sp.]|uniref:Thioredoxin n=1 Tax=uncultured Paludibacter sp. TaxID=497635 RepID=A0A653ABL1_9BACT|nr:Thioredoxin [uncultured Paludibacter sp.]
MKKLAFAALLLTFTFTSCAGNANKTTSQTEDNKTEKNKVLTENKETKTMEPIHLTKEEFLKKVANYEQNPNEWKYLGDKPCLIDFYADWCSPCKMIAPILEDLAKEYAGQIYIYKINTEEEQELAAAFGIRSIPSLLFVPMEGQPQMAMGALPKATFKEAIDDVLLNKKK